MINNYKSKHLSRFCQVAIIKVHTTYKDVCFSREIVKAKVEGGFFLYDTRIRRFSFISYANV